MKYKGSIFLPLSIRLTKANQLLLRSFLMRLRRFLTRVEKVKPGGLNKLKNELDKEVWQEVNCLDCANCCKSMTPTFTTKDIKRIAAHFKQTPQEFTNKWLYKEAGTGDMMNKQQPCQFLNLKNNKCSIYDIRPDDCRGFPHHTKKDFTEWVHVYKQNIAYCPATYKLVEKMRERLGKI